MARNCTSRCVYKCRTSQVPLVVGWRVISLIENNVDLSRFTKIVEFGDYSVFSTNKPNKNIINIKMNKINARRRKTIPQKRKIRSRPKIPRGPKLDLEPCTVHYLAALSEPFSPDAAGACVPSFPARSSQKSSAITRLTVSIGSAGVGFLALNPCVANDAPTGWFTNSTYAGTTIAIQPTAVVAGTFSFNMSTNPYGIASYTSGTATANSDVTSKIVAVGARWRYTGTELNKGGLTYALVHPDHGNVNGMSISLMSTYKETSIRPTSRQWNEVSISAIDEHETSYPDAAGLVAIGMGANPELVYMAYPYSQGACIDSISTNQGAAPFGILFQGTPGNSYAVEVIMLLESVGSVTNNMATRSHTDLKGLGVATNAAGSAQSTMAATDKITWKQAVLEAVAKEYITHQDHYNGVATGTLNALGTLVRGGGGGGRWRQIRDLR